MVLGRDVLLLIACAVILLTVGYMSFPPSIWGKATTFFEILLVVLVLVLAVHYYHCTVDLARSLQIYRSGAGADFRGELQHRRVGKASCRGNTTK